LLLIKEKYKTTEEKQLTRYPIIARECQGRELQMPGPKYTKIEITPEAFLALESETILQGKTLKKLASELILNGVSKDSLEFAERAMASNGGRIKSNEKIAKIVKDIGVSEIKFDETILGSIQNIIKEKSNFEAMLFVAQHTASMQRDELHRVLTICEYHNISPSLKEEIIKNLNSIESGMYP
jgi:hypothetical protein